MSILLVVLAACVAYPYVVYPLILWLLARGTRRSASHFLDDDGSLETRSVSVLLSVHNEEEVIAAKIQNLLDQNYPLDKLEMIIVSDGSTDATENVVRRTRPLGDSPRVQLMSRAREGKTAALNVATKVARGEIFVFTDANTMFCRDAIAKLVAPFKDHRVGLVSGQAMSADEESGEGIYQRFERFLKIRESQYGIVAGADGAIYALRRELYEPLDPALISDLFHPIQIALSGKRSVFEPTALASELTRHDDTREFRRQKRMAAQAFGVLWQTLGSLVCAGRLVATWVLVSHKLVRWGHVPAACLCFVLATVFGLQHESHWVGGVWIALAVLLGIGGVIPSSGSPKIFRLIREFEIVHLAYFLGVIDFLRGQTNITWQPRGGASSDD